MIKLTKTWLDHEEECTDYDQFARKGVAILDQGEAESEELVDVRADIPDTFFTIPAYAVDKKENPVYIGYITSGNVEQKPDFIFVPYRAGDGEILTVEQYFKNSKLFWEAEKEFNPRAEKVLKVLNKDWKPATKIKKFNKVRREC